MAAANIHVITLDSDQLPVTHVTVFSDRAEVTKAVKVKLAQGQNEVVVKKLVDSINSDSIRVEGYGNAVINEVKYEEKRITKDEKIQEKDKELNERLKKLQDEKQMVEQNEERLKKVRQVLDGLAAQLGKGSGGDKSTGEKAETNNTPTFNLLNENSLERLTEFLTFYEKRAGEVDRESNEVGKKLEKLSEEISVIEDNLSQNRYDNVYVSKEVSIFLTANEAGEVNLDLFYMVYHAYWEPSYDVRVFTDEKLMKIYYYGMIRQTTDEDWKNCKITLSTAVPSIGGQVPELKTTKVGFYKPPPPVVARPEMGGAGMTCYAMAANECVTMKSVAPRRFKKSLADSAPMMEVQLAKVSENVTSATFEIEIPTTIPSDPSSHKVTIAIVDLKPEFHYECVPSKSTYAFFKAEVRNTGAYPFLEGPTSIFVDNSFVAKGHMKAVNTSEKFSVSLGADPGLKIDYKSARKFQEESGILNKSTVLTHEQRIGVHNTKTATVKLTLLEPLPQSTDEKIKVNLLEPSPARSTKSDTFSVNKENNAEWHLEMAAGDKRDLVLKYQIEHPKGEHLEYKEE